MLRLLVRWVVNTLVLFLVCKVVPNFHYDDWISLAIAALVLGVLNTIVRPILFALTLPITVLTLGLFYFVLNAVMLKMTAWLAPGFDIDGFGWALLGALVFTAVSLVTDDIARKKEER